MPRNGTGTYTLASPPGAPQNGQTASATDMTTLLQDMATALTASTANDGQTTITGNWDFKSYNISGVGTMSAAVASTTGAATVGNLLTVTKGGATIAGNSTVTGTLTVSSTVGAAAGTKAGLAVIYDQFPVTTTSPGTMTFPGGLIIKWGTGTITSGSGTVAFAVAFPTACRNVQITPSGGTVPVNISAPTSGNVTASGFNAYADAAQTFGFNWFAVGV